MVTVTVFAEGGVLPGDSVDVATMDNSAALRQSLNRIFSESIEKRDDVQIVVEMKAGYKNVCKEFLRKADDSVVMFVDSECPAQDIPKWFEVLDSKDSINIPEDRRKNIYFMIQEMEAWILKDLQSVERWADLEGLTRVDLSPLAEHSLVRNKDVEDISKPSEKLRELVKHFFKRNGKKAKYGKLKTAPAMLDCVNVGVLKSLDSELTKFATNFSGQVLF